MTFGMLNNFIKNEPLLNQVTVAHATLLNRQTSRLHKRELVCTRSYQVQNSFLRGISTDFVKYGIKVSVKKNFPHDVASI